MSITCGFYNALEHDRLYDAIQMSSLFDGIIRDGVFSTIGDSLVVNAPGDGLYVVVKSGRAWFNHSWTLNDTEYPISFDDAELVLDRIDAVVLEINSSVEVRDNSIKIIKGTPNSRPVNPTLIHNAEVNQYALAYVRIRAGATAVSQADVVNAVGTNETPFVTGVLQQVSITDLLTQWETEFNDYFSNFQTVSNNTFSNWMATKIAEYTAWFAQMQTDMNADFTEFDTWFQHMKDQLDSDAAGHLQAEIDVLALQAAKGSEVTVTTINSSLFNRAVTITQDGHSVTAQFNSSGVAVFSNVPYIGTVSISSTDGIQTATSSLNIPYFGRYSTSIAFWAAVVTITTSTPEFYGQTITVSKNDTPVAMVSFDNLGQALYTASEMGEYTFAINYEGTDYEVTVDVTSEDTYYVTLDAWTATFNITATITELYDQEITISKGGVIVGTTTFDSSGNASYKVHEPGTYTIEATDTGGYTFTDTVNVTAEIAYNLSMGSITKTITVYSAANDTVRFTDATGAKSVTTNSSGQGSVSITFLPPSQNITFTSSVAKQPNWSTAYSKTIAITPTTSSIKVMPNRALYWWGYNGGVQAINSANGWSNPKNGGPTWEAQRIYVTNVSGFGTSSPQTFTKAHLMWNRYYSDNTSRYWGSSVYTYKNGNTTNQYPSLTNFTLLNGGGQNSNSYNSISGSWSNQYVMFNVVVDTYKFYFYAFWLE